MAEDRVERRLAAILSADVVGYSRLMGADEVQLTLAERNAEIPEDRRIEFRVGIDLGDVIVEDDDIYGGGVNVAARLQEPKRWRRGCTCPIA